MSATSPRKRKALAAAARRQNLSISSRGMTLRVSINVGGGLRALCFVQSVSQSVSSLFEDFLLSSVSQCYETERRIMVVSAGRLFAMVLLGSGS